MKRENIITSAMRELRAAITEAEAITGKQGGMTKQDEARTNVLLAKIAALRQNALSPSNEASRRWLKNFVKGATVESRGTDVLAGTQTLTYSEGPAGGIMVPVEFNEELVLGMAQYDPLLDEDLVTLIQSDTFALRPFNAPGWDLSTYAAIRVGEGNQQNPQTVPAVAQAFLNGYTYKATLDASFEFEDDGAWKPTMDLMSVAFSIGMARGIGKDLILGSGSAQPQGIVTGAHNSGVTTGASTVYTYVDIENIYFSLDRFYRNAEKCAWVMGDATYEAIRKAVDGNQRPLINVVGDKELLMGKPILVSPSMPVGASNKTVVFGDLAHYMVRLSAIQMTRSMQAPGYVDKGKGLYTCLARADAQVLDPTGGQTPPIVYATQHA